MNFISLCSGIEAASVAFGPLGWKAIAFSEIEGFPSAVLAHHYPTVRNYGDMSLFRDWPDELFADADAIVGGPPCQAFSVAGARRGLLDARGNLTLIYVELLDHADDIRRKYGKPPIVALYENVPGIFSDRTNAFGCLVGGLAGEDVPVVPPGKRWTDAGCVFGPERAVAWRLFDAQFFALAQRRRRVFVVASARKGFDPAKVLFEWDGVRRDTAPSREAREGIAGGVEIGPGGGRFTDLNPTLDTRAKDGPIRNQLAGAVITMAHGQGGGLGTDFDCDGGLIQAYGGNNQSGPIDVATARNACASASGRMDFETETFLVQPAHSLRGEGFDASEDGTGRGTPLGPMFLHTNKGRPDGRRSAHTEMVSVKDIVETLTTDGHAQSAVAVPVAYGIRTANTSSNGWGIQEECTHTLDCAQGVAVAQPVAFSSKDYGADATNDLAPTLRAMNHAESHANGGGQMAVAQAMRVRRLTPTEAERLMGFSDDYTAIPWRKKPADQCPDGPRYRALGNSWAIPCVSWIGERIARQINSSTTSPHPAGFFKTTL